MLWAITGGAGFLGLHLARRLLADGHEVRTLDLMPLDDVELERDVEELRGDVRDPSAAATTARRRSRPSESPAARGGAGSASSWCARRPSSDQSGSASSRSSST